VDSIATGKIRYQCVYVKMAETEGLMQAHAHALEVVNGGGNKEEKATTTTVRADAFMPHMSLAYGIDDEDLRERVAGRAREQILATLMHDVMDVACVALWETDGADTTCASWRRVAGVNVG
jgi:hypothetical protein